MGVSDFVQLAAGPIVPIAAWRLALDLESRGCSLHLDGDALVIGPREKLTQADRDAIRRWRNHLCALVAYEPPTVH